ncbi:MAG: hypothetical protein GWP59_05650 [Chlamydiales bacterium]|nr:acylphosphatase [Chlamydiales bacterium]NCF71168.1 hypothetical protein [Chlamydiales bacterium]
MKEKIRLQAIFSGTVQGVSFRVTAKMHASDLNIQGSVRNLQDGKVELIAEAPRMVLEELICRLENDDGPSSISNIQKKYSDPQNSYTDFSILH